MMKMPVMISMWLLHEESIGEQLSGMNFCLYNTNIYQIEGNSIFFQIIICFKINVILGQNCEFSG